MFGIMGVVVMVMPPMVVVMVSIVDHAGMVMMAGHLWPAVGGSGRCSLGSLPIGTQLPLILIRGIRIGIGNSGDRHFYSSLFFWALKGPSFPLPFPQS